MLGSVVGEAAGLAACLDWLQLAALSSLLRLEQKLRVEQLCVGWLQSRVFNSPLGWLVERLLVEQPALIGAVLLVEQPCKDQSQLAALGSTARNGW